ncbi:MAG: efflux RND transporter periplasmic adaptor subunit, partial [Bacteroidetes bacterium]|nr:efflux RND transporter periplasmic adaptor subunit [Bacteroidota bacterium]
MNDLLKNVGKFIPSRYSIVAGLAALAFSFTIQGCGSSDAKDDVKERKTEHTETPAQEVFSLQKGQLNSSFRLPGELISFQQVDLYAKVNSFIKKLYVDVGSEVKTGQLLAVMEAPEINSQLSAAESKLKSQEAVYIASKATYDRLFETSKTPGTISPNDLDIALAKEKSDLAQLEADKASYREILDTKNYLEIRAPFNGVISTRNVSAGAYVGPSGKGSDLPIFTLQQQNKLRLVISVPEAYATYLNQKNEVQFSVKGLPEQVFKAKVSRLAGALDIKLRAQRTEMDVENTNKKLLPGMVAEVSVPLYGNANTFIVPKSAIVNSTVKPFVIKVVNNKAQWVKVEIGKSADDKEEIFGDLNTGDELIKNATEEIR